MSERPPVTAPQQGPAAGETQHPTPEPSAEEVPTLAMEAETPIEAAAEVPPALEFPVGTPAPPMSLIVLVLIAVLLSAALLWWLLVPPPRAVPVAGGRIVPATPSLLPESPAPATDLANSAAPRPRVTPAETPGSRPASPATPTTRPPSAASAAKAASAASANGATAATGGPAAPTGSATKPAPSPEKTLDDLLK